MPLVFAAPSSSLPLPLSSSSSSSSESPPADRSSGTIRLPCSTATGPHTSASFGMPIAAARIPMPTKEACGTLTFSLARGERNEVDEDGIGGSVKMMDWTRL